MALDDFMDALRRRQPASMMEALFGLTPPVTAAPLGGQLPPSAVLPSLARMSAPPMTPSAAPSGSALAGALRRPTARPATTPAARGSSAASAMRGQQGRHLATSVRGKTAPGVKPLQTVTRRPEPAPGRFSPGPVHLPRAPRMPGMPGFSSGRSGGRLADATRRKRNPFDGG